MHKLLRIFFLLLTTSTFSQVKLLSWNVENLGSSKSEKDIVFIVKTIKDYDVVALQEIVAGDGGAQAVAKLADELNKKGTKWDYTISAPTSSSAYKTERYAFLWKTSKVKKIGDAWLEKKYHLEIDREPYYCTFDYNGKQFTIANFHAITKSKQPETEIKYFKFLPNQYPELKTLVQQMQMRLQKQFSQLSAQVMKRPTPDELGQVTWMEIYDLGSSDLSVFKLELDRAAAQEKLPQPRRTEHFVNC